MSQDFRASQLIRFAEEGRTDECLALLAGVGPNEKGSKGTKGSSAFKGVAVVNVNTRDENGWSALHKAAEHGRVQTLEALLRSGAWVDSLDTAGLTPLHLAARGGHVQAMKALIACRANPCAQDGYGRAPAHYAASCGNTQAVLALLGAGADFWAKTSNGFSLLHLAAQAGKLDLVLALLERGADVNAKTTAGYLALDLLGHLPSPIAGQLEMAMLAYGVQPAQASRDKPYLSGVSMHQAAALGGFSRRMHQVLLERPSASPDDAPERLVALARAGHHLETAAVVEAFMARQSIEKLMAGVSPTPAGSWVSGF